MKLIKWSIILAVFFCWVGSVHALVYHVSPTGNDSPPWPCGVAGNPCRTIGHAVSIAVNGDTIKVAQGFYWENVSIDTSISDLTIQGGWNSDFSARTEDPSKTTVFNKRTDISVPVFSIITGVWEVISVTIEGFTIRGSYTIHKIGIRIISYGRTDLTLLNNRITDNKQTGVTIESRNGEISVVLNKNQIMWNLNPASISGTGGGISARSNGSDSIVDLTLEKNFISHNKADYGGGIFFISQSGANLQATMENNVLMHNTAIISGGGIFVSSQGIDSELTLNLTNNTITKNNSNQYGGGIEASSFSDQGITNHINIHNTVVWGNTADIIGNDIFIDNSTSTVNASYSDIGEVFTYHGGIYNPGPGNLNTDPSFDTDFHLLPKSPVIDKGQCGVKFLNIYIRRAPYDDIDGDPRPGFDKFWGCDIGADEYIVKAMSWIPLLLF